MKLLVFSHKVVWKSEKSPTGWATDGGYVFHMQSLASAYEQTVLLVPVSKHGKSKGEVWFRDSSIKIVPLLKPFGSGITRKLLFPIWFLMHLPRFVYYLLKSDVVHAPIPGDIGTIGMILAPLFRKKIFIRYCGNWQQLKTFPEKFWAWYGERFAANKIAYLCTGGDIKPPSEKNPSLGWIFSSSMLDREIENIQPKDFDSNKEFNIVMGGRLTQEKGFGILIEAVAMIRNKIPNLKVLLFGDGPAGPLFDEQVKNFGLGGTVEFLGKLNTEQVHGVLASADVFCYPTQSEGFPKVIIEALSHGLPIVSTPVSVIPFLINSAERPAGFVVDQKDREGLAEKILFYFHNPAIHRAHSKNAKQIASEYSLENWVDAINEKLNKQWKTKICRLRDIKK